MAYGRGGGKPAYDNNMRGALFENNDARNAKDPQMKGQCEVDGVEYWVAAWWKKSDKVGEFLSFSLTPKEEKRAPSEQRGNYGPGNRPGQSRAPSREERPRGRYDDRREPDPDEDIPF